jgi:Ca-activated chloride channel homolog
MSNKHFILTCVLFVSQILMSFAQTNEYIRKGNANFQSNDFKNAEEYYNKALSKNNQSVEAAFNLGDALFRQEKYEDATKQFDKITNLTDDKNIKSLSFYNKGNALLMDKKIEESIAAYKNALRNNPSNEAARYNLAFAQKLLEKQQQEQQEEKKQDKNEEKENKEEQEKNDQQEENQQEDNQQKEENKNEEQNKNEQKEQEQPQPKKDELSKEDAQRLLDAMNEQEKDTQDKLLEQKVKGKKIVIEKDW